MGNMHRSIETTYVSRQTQHRILGLGTVPWDLNDIHQFDTFLLLMAPQLPAGVTMSRFIYGMSARANI